MGADFLVARRRVAQPRQYFARPRFLDIVVDPYFGLHLHERHFAQCAGGIDVENVGDDAEAGQRIDSQLGVEQGGRDENPFHRRAGKINRCGGRAR